MVCTFVCVIGECESVFIVTEVAICISNDFYTYIFDREVCVCGGRGRCVYIK